MTQCKNDAEMVVSMRVPGAAAAVAIPVVHKAITVEATDGNPVFVKNDTFTFTVTRNPLTISNPVAGANNTGVGTATAVVIGKPPVEMWELKFDGTSFIATGSKSRLHEVEIPVDTAVDIVLSKISMYDDLMRVMYFPTDALAISAEVPLTDITIADGTITCATFDSSAGELTIEYIDRSAG